MKRATPPSFTHASGHQNVDGYRDATGRWMVEVLTDAFVRDAASPRIMRRRRVPVYYFTIYRRPAMGGVVTHGRFTYRPATRPKHLVLADRTVTRLVREYLDPRRGVN